MTLDNLNEENLNASSAAASSTAPAMGSAEADVVSSVTRAIYKREPSKSNILSRNLLKKMVGITVQKCAPTPHGFENHHVLQKRRVYNGKDELNWRAENLREYLDNIKSHNQNGIATEGSNDAQSGSNYSASNSSSSASINGFVDVEAFTADPNCDDIDSHHKRPPQQRVFVNRNLRLEKIQFFGFDMDYTLAVYKSPQMEKMSFGLIVERLISIGYPDEFRSFEYNPIFPVRGLWFDSEYGNLLKVDGFGSILVAVHGFKFLKPAEIEEFYPNKFLHLSERVYVLNTLFNLPETYLVACVVNYFDKHPSYHLTSDKTGLKSGDVVMSYKSLFQDIRNSVDWVHFGSGMKKEILSNLEHYVEKDDRIVQLLTLLRNSGQKTFLLTNSEYAFTNGIMTYLLGADWTSFFDITVVDARKPLWFGEGTVFREVDTKSGALKIGIHAGPLRRGAVYSGGSCDSFRRLVKARGKDVLYIGDHIFGDVLRSKKTKGWRTFLVVPELEHELLVWTGKRPLFEKLRELDSVMADIYKNLDGATRDKPKIDNILNSIRAVTHEMDQEYGVIGSLFRSGSRTTFFASQVERYADLYASSCYNLVHYPIFYFFRAPMTLMPHESTVDHAARMREARESSVGQRVRDWNKSAKSTTFGFEEDNDEDEDGAASSNSEATDSHQKHPKGKRGSSRKATRTATATTTSSKNSPRSPTKDRKESDDVSSSGGGGRAGSPSGGGLAKMDASKSGGIHTTDVVVPKSSYVEDEH